MGHGYWLPPEHEKLPAFDGFFVDSEAVYTGADITSDWNSFLDTICSKIKHIDSTLKKICKWQSCGMGQNRFVLLQNRDVDIIAEEMDDYIAVYAIISEECENIGYAKRLFQKYVNGLKNVLTTLYPGHVRHRGNFQKTVFVE